MLTGETPGPADDRGLADTLRDVLLGADYTSAGVGAVLPAVRQGLRTRDLPLYDRQVPPSDPLRVLIRLWLLGLPVSEDDAGRALAPLDLRHLEEAHLLSVVDEVATSRAQLLCVGDLLLFGDRDDAILEQPGWVAASSPTAQLLDHLTVRRPVGSSLDVGCGSGMLALLAARHSDRVTAADLNPRAIAFTRLNARLNNASRLDLRRGSWFEPVAGDQFDLIVSNPPFVVSPDSGLLFRDSPLPADDVSRMVATEAVPRLTEGGFAHVLCNWALREGEDWEDPPRRWLADAGCDALVLHFGTDDPMSYAATWNAPLRSEDPSAFSETLDRWLDYYRRLGITALCAGAVVVRRRSGQDNWVRTLSLPLRPEEPAGDQVLRLFEGQDVLAALPSEDALRDATIRLVDRHEVRQILNHQGGGYHSHRCTVATTSGLRLAIEVEPDVLQVILRLDGSRTVADVVDDVAQQMGFDRAGLLGRTLPAIRELLRHGFVHFPDSAGRAG